MTYFLEGSWDAANLYNFSKVKKNRQWLKVHYYLELVAIFFSSPVLLMQNYNNSLQSCAVLKHIQHRSKRHANVPILTNKHPNFVREPF